MIKKVKNTVPWVYVINDLDGEETVGTFYENKVQKTNEENLELKKYSREKAAKYMLNEKDIIFHLIAG